MKKHLFKEATQITNRHMKNCSISLVVRKMHIKTTLRKNNTLSYHFTPIRIVKIKKKRWTTKMFEERNEELGLLYRSSSTYSGVTS